MKIIRWRCGRCCTMALSMRLCTSRIMVPGFNVDECPYHLMILAYRNGSARQVAMYEHRIKSGEIEGACTGTEESIADVLPARTVRERW